MGSKSFNYPCVLSKNGYAYETDILLDTGANGYAFLDTHLFHLLSPMFKLRKQSLENFICVQAFNGQKAEPITHFTFLFYLFILLFHLFTPLVITGKEKEESIALARYSRDPTRLLLLRSPFFYARSALTRNLEKLEGKLH